MPSSHQLMLARVKVLIAGICSLILMVGIARFAYTPLLPVMQAEALLNSAEGAWLASINYLGYLSGALIAASISDLRLKDRLYRLGLIVALLSSAAMALSHDWWLWVILRYLAGLSSAAGMLLGSGLVLNWLMRHHFRSELGIHFTGMGLGIAFCALAVEYMSGAIPSSQQWLWLAAVGLFLLIPAWGWLPRPEHADVTISGVKLVDRPPSRLFLRLFMAAYFCAGTGYVVSATFIVALVEQQPGLSEMGNWVFLLVGLAAIPACIVWDRIARRIGHFNALIAACVLQTLGIGLPLLSDGLFAAVASAVLFGGTFIGIVSLVLTMAGRYFPSRPAKMMGKMTLSYSLAQMLVPGVIAIMAGPDGGYQDGLLLAGGMMIIGCGLLIMLRYLEDEHQRLDTHQPLPSTK